MTSRQTGKRISSMYGARTVSRSQRRQSRPESGKSGGRDQRRLAQLVICGTLFVVLVAVKLILPAKMDRLRTSLESLMNQNMDVEQVFSAVGRAFSGEEDVKNTLDEVYQAVFHPEDSDIVETAAPAASSVELPNPLTSMRAFVQGREDSSGWMFFHEDPERTLTGNQTDHSSPSSSASGTASSEADEAQAMQISSVLYSGENLPSNVSLEQAVLGFDYCVPVCGTLSSGFGYREHPIEGEEKFHYGVDLAANTGTEIDCFADGTVTAVGESSSYGKYLTVAHSDGYTTLYAHCSAVLVSSGTKVKEGQKIAEVGETGLATGPHLHFELHEGETYLDPIYYVSPT